ncbi:MAG: class I lanthipeptide [Dinghuibacter sp.]|nr:class I lanthipeptide [Dinghuibacter sp.]
MKKNIKKLSLRKTTLSLLNTADRDAARGGVNTWDWNVSCYYNSCKVACRSRGTNCPTDIC